MIFQKYPMTSLETTRLTKMAEPNANKIKAKLKCNVFLRLFLSYRLLFGYYYHLSSSKVVRFTARLYCVFITCVISSIVYKSFIKTTEYYVAKSYFSLFIFEINIHILVSLFTSEYSVITFTSNVCNIVKLERLSTSQLWCYVTPVLVLISHCFTAISVFISSLLQDRLNSILFSRILPTTMIFTGRLTSLYVMEIYKIAIKLLRESVTASFTDKDQSDREKVEHVKKFLRVYMDLLHALNKTLYVVKYQVSFYV